MRLGGRLQLLFIFSDGLLATVLGFQEPRFYDLALKNQQLSDLQCFVGPLT